ncbi:MAG: hypothetical protein JW838_14015 [Spirochaetes bacterium]|nr:hypothetical protein [Spirochaetota bacterium]
MGERVAIHKRLDVYMQERQAEAGPHALEGAPFGPGREGEYIDPWRMGIGRIGYFGRAYTVIAPGGGSVVEITVPVTGTGVAPTIEAQPFGWSGPINEYAAELAVWWAFDLLTEDEARLFLAEHRPAVFFRYVEGGRARELEVRFDGMKWMAVSTT